MARESGRILVLALAVLAGCGERTTTAPDLPRERPKGTVEVVSVPPGAMVILEEGERRLGPAPQVIERAGGTGLKLMLVKEGYRPKHSFVLVEERNRMVHRVVLERERATLVVRAGALHGAEVLIDGRTAGMTPTRVQVPAGVDVALEVRKSRFQPYTATLRLQAGETREVSADLLPEGFKGPRPGHLTVTGPVGAVVQLKGRMLGVVPVERIPLPPGRHALRIRSADGKRRWDRTAEIRSGEETSVTLD